MKKIVAVLFVTLSIFLILGVAINGTQKHPHDAAYALGSLVGMILDFSFLFFSVRWYIKLSGHSYRLARQTWAAILFWYSMFAVLFGIGALANGLIAMGLTFLILWSGIGFVCWKWRQGLRRAEAQINSFPPSSGDPAI